MPKQEYEYCDVCDKELEEPDDKEHGRHLECKMYSQ